MKDKSSKKVMLKNHATKTFSEINAMQYQSSVLIDAQKFLRLLNDVDESGSEKIFRQAEQMLDEDGVKKVIAIFDSKNKQSYGSTEEKVEAFLNLALKQRLEPLDALAQQINEMKAGMFSRLLVLYGNLCVTKSDRYNNTPFVNLLIAHQRQLSSKDKDDESMCDLTEMMSSAKI